MDIKLVIPFAIGLISLLLCFVVLYFLPETIELSESPPESRRRNQNTKSYSTSPRTPLKFMAEETLAVIKQKNTLLVLPIFFISTFRATTLNVLRQYTAVRFGWKLSKVC